jgi:DNA-binding transcriptional ArsR family regulator
MDDIERISTPQQHRALAHPARQRMLFRLGREAATLSRLAADLGISKGSAAYHLKVLREAGLVHLESTRKVRGGTEEYFRRSFERIRLDGDETRRAALAAVADELAADEDPFLTIRNIRLGPAQAARVRQALESLVAELEDEEGEPRYGVLVGLYNPSH